MTIETSNAFGSLDARADAQEKGPVRDRISLRDHIVSVDIGAFQAERGALQRLRFNVVVEVVDPSEDPDDDVDKILSYDRVTEAIDAELQLCRLNLVETLAEKIADRILREPQARRVYLRIEKLDRGTGALGVEIMRDAEAAPGSSTLSEPLELPQAPRIVMLSMEAAHSPHLPVWLDQLTALPDPLLLCALPDHPADLQAETSAAQQRIALLNMEQCAWVLAARDDRCAVVETRTELDWSLRNGQVAVWAPSKLVLDTPHSPLAQADDPLALSLWLARYLKCSDLQAIGEFSPKNAEMPCTVHSAQHSRLSASCTGDTHATDRDND